MTNVLEDWEAKENTSILSCIQGHQEKQLGLLETLTDQFGEELGPQDMCICSGISRARRRYSQRRDSLMRLHRELAWEKGERILRCLDVLGQFWQKEQAEWKEQDPCAFPAFHPHFMVPSEAPNRNLTNNNNNKRKIAIEFELQHHKAEDGGRVGVEGTGNLLGIWCQLWCSKRLGLEWGRAHEKMSLFTLMNPVMCSPTIMMLNPSSR